VEEEDFVRETLVAVNLWLYYLHHSEFTLAGQHGSPLICAHTQSPLANLTFIIELLI
jgi:hypothetical protein